VAILDMPPVEVRRSWRFSRRRILEHATQRFRSLFDRRLAGRPDDENLRARLRDRRFTMYERVMRKHKTQPYAGKLLVIRAAQGRSGGHNVDPSLGWWQYVQRVDTAAAPGDHLGILEGPGAASIAQTLRTHLP
jgi:thioesterase domain-containing protein